MLSRRNFVQGAAWGLASSTAGWRAAKAAIVQRRMPSGGPFHIVVFDKRYPESVAFANKASATGEHMRGLDNGDVTPVWYDDLYHRWKIGPVAIAGLTAPGALFVLQAFGNDAGLRLQFKAKHHCFDDRVEHCLYGPGSMLRGTQALEASGHRWGVAMQQLIGDTSTTDFDRGEANATTPLSVATSARECLLVSWILAPRSAANQGHEYG